MSDLLGPVMDTWTTTRANEWEAGRWGIAGGGARWVEQPWWWLDFPRPFDREDVFQLGDAAEATLFHE